MRLLRVIPSLDPRHGGPGEGIRQTTGRLAARGHETAVACIDAPDSDWFGQYAFPVHGLGPGVTAWGYAPDFRPWLEAHVARFDRVLVHGLWQYVGYAARSVAVDRGVPYYVYTHGMLDPWFKRTYPVKHAKKWMFWPWSDYRLLRDAEAVLFTTEEERRLARDSFFLSEWEGRVVGYGTGGPPPEGESAPEPLYERHPELVDRRMVLFLGRIHPKKGCDLLIRAFAEVLREGPEWHLVMAGPDQVGRRAELESIAREKDVADRITWTGMVEGPLKWATLRAADVLVLPSHQENFGIVVAEALACGVPVLTTRRVNTHREVESSGAGFVDRDTQGGIARLLARWRDLSDEERSRMGERARAAYLRHFEMESVVDRFLSVLTPKRRSSGHLPVES